MKVDVIISADDIKEEKIKDKIVVVIDVLRATSVMVTALKNGCKAIIPVKTVEEAKDIASQCRNSYVLGGERQGLKIDGFDLSNSPLEYTEPVVKEKTVVMTTSNGTQAIKNSECAKRIFIGALINGTAISKKVLSINQDVVFVNAGTYGQFSMDDFITTGYMIDRLRNIAQQQGMEEVLELTDVAKTSEYIYNSNPTVTGYLKNALHYKRMEELGYFEDLTYCLSKDNTDIVPEYIKGYVKI